MWGLYSKYKNFCLFLLCNCNLLGRDLLATLGIQNNIVKSDTETSSIVSLCQMSQKVYAAVNLQMQAVPGKWGK